MSNQNLPRGIRNNNPGNIRITKTNWKGEIVNPKEKAFETFEDAVSVHRATMILLINYS